MTAFLAALLAFIKAFPAFVSLVNRLIALSQKHGLDVWLSDLEKSIDQLEKAESPHDKYDAGRSILDVLKRLD